jgi:hypothetical protein
MNSHQRRTLIRRKHMIMPLGKEVVIPTYVNRLVTKMTAFRHRSGRPGSDGPWRVDVRIDYQNGTSRVYDFRLCYVHLKNPADRAPRPWWSQMTRDAR